MKALMIILIFWSNNNTSTSQQIEFKSYSKCHEAVEDKSRWMMYVYSQTDDPPEILAFCVSNG